MVPKHNDDPYSDDEEEQEKEIAPNASKVLMPVEAAAIRMPLKLTSSLTGKLAFWSLVSIQMLNYRQS